MKKMILTLISLVLFVISLIYFFLSRPAVINTYTEFSAEGPFTNIPDIIYGLIFIGALSILYLTHIKKPQQPPK